MASLDGFSMTSTTSPQQKSRRVLSAGRTRGWHPISSNAPAARFLGLAALLVGCASEDSALGSDSASGAEVGGAEGTDNGGDDASPGSTSGNASPGTEAGDDSSGTSAGGNEPCSDWTYEFGSLDNNYATAVAVDGEDLFIAGSTIAGLEGLRGQVNEFDGFLIKQSTEGVEEWRILVASEVDDLIHGVAADRVGGAFVGGRSTGDVNGVPSGEQVRGSVGFVSRFTSTGEHAWTRYLPATVGAVVSDTDSVYFAHRDFGDQFDDPLVWKLSADGKELWNFAMRGGTSGLALDGQGGVVVTGKSDVDLETGGTRPEGEDDYLLRLDEQGELDWFSYLGMQSTNVSIGSTGIAVGGGGDIFLSASIYTGPPGFPRKSDLDGLVMKFSADGSHLWNYKFGTTGTPEPVALQWGYDRAHGVAVDSTNHVYVTGYTWGDLNGETSAGYNDAFLVKVSPEGAPVWTRLLGSNSSDEGEAVTIDSSDRAYVVGASAGELPGAMFTGQADAFVARVCDPL